jgi:hypothetical protein
MNGTKTYEVKELASMTFTTVTISVPILVISDILTSTGHNTQILLEGSTKTDAIISR